MTTTMTTEILFSKIKPSTQKSVYQGSGEIFAGKPASGFGEYANVVTIVLGLESINLTEEKLVELRDVLNSFIES